MTPWGQLSAACDRALIDALPESTKAAIRDAYAAGCTPKRVMQRVRAGAGFPRRNQRGHLTVLACEAYLESLTADPHADDARCPVCGGRGGWEDPDDGQWVTCKRCQGTGSVPVES